MASSNVTNRKALKDSVRALKSFFRFDSIHRLTQSNEKNVYLTDAFGSVNDDDTLEGKLANILLDIDGTLDSREIEKALDKLLETNDVELEEKVKKLVEMHSTVLNNGRFPVGDLSAVLGVHETMNGDSKATPSLSTINVNSIEITPAVRNTSAVNIFMNGIPTIEMSKCVPYIRMTIYTPGKPSSGGRLNSLSLFKLLQGARDVRPDDALYDNRLFNDKGQVGLEIFTSPQTLTDVGSMRGPYEKLRAARVADPFAGLLSINELVVNVVPQRGMMNYKSGTLKLTLHDHTRLNEIANFIKPDLYSETELLIEYGWSHSGANNNSATNYYADFLNSMRVEEKYSVKNSSFVFDEAGQVHIDLQIAMKGGLDQLLINVTSDKRVKSAQEEVQRLASEIGKYRERVFATVDGQFKADLRGMQVLDAAAGANLQLDMSEEFLEALKDMKISLQKIKSQNTLVSPSAKALYNSLVQLYGNSAGHGGAIDTLRKSIDDVVNEKIQSIKSRDSIDPYLPEGLNKNGLKQFVSLGKLFSLFVQLPLAMGTQKFDDVQFIYYLFNANAADASDKTISQFAININDFHTSYMKIAHSLNRAHLNVFEFINFIQNRFLSDITTHGYGVVLRNASKLQRDDAGKIKQDEIDPADLRNQLENLAKKGKLPNGQFVMPVVDAYVEAMPPKFADVGKLVPKEKTILKIHFFDRAATPYLIPKMLNDAAVASDMRTLATWDEKSDTEQKHREAANKLIKFAAEQGVFEYVDGGDKKKSFLKVKDQARLKRYMKRVVPSITYGSENTAVTQLGLKSMQDPKLTTLNMMRAGKQGPMTPEGLGPGGLPLRIAPAQLDMTTLGCPLVAYGQQFFVDLGTGTTIDNIYAPFNLTHTLAPGKFETKLSLNPLDAYGTYESLFMAVGKSSAILKDLIKEED